MPDKAGFGDDIKFGVKLLDGVESSIVAVLPIATKDAAEYIAEGVRLKTPRGKTGQLLESVGVEEIDTDARDGDVSYRVVVKEFYGRFLEFGTKYISAIGFVSAAVKARRNKAKKIIQDHIEEAAGRAVSVRSRRK